MFSTRIGRKMVWLLPLQLMFLQCQTLWFAEQTIFFMSPSTCCDWSISLKASFCSYLLFATSRFAIIIFLQKLSVTPAFVPDQVNWPSGLLKFSVLLLESWTALTSPYSYPFTLSQHHALECEHLKTELCLWVIGKY